MHEAGVLSDEQYAEYDGRSKQCLFKTTASVERGREVIAKGASHSGGRLLQ